MNLDYDVIKWTKIYINCTQPLTGSNYGAIKTNRAVKGFQMLVDRVSLGNPFTTISFHLYVLLKVSWGTQSIYWNVMILNKVLSEIIFITRLFLLKVLSTPQSKLFVCLFKCLYIRTLSTVLCTRRLSIQSWMHEMVTKCLYIYFTSLQLE